MLIKLIAHNFYLSQSQIPNSHKQGGDRQVKLIASEEVFITAALSIIGAGLILKFIGYAQSDMITLHLNG
jgi:hypothetical protein